MAGLLYLSMIVFNRSNNYKNAKLLLKVLSRESLVREKKFDKSEHVAHCFPSQRHNNFPCAIELQHLHIVQISTSWEMTGSFWKVQPNEWKILEIVPQGRRNETNMNNIIYEEQFKFFFVINLNDFYCLCTVKFIWSIYFMCAYVFKLSSVS
jgi:hypothetical protein